ncbi:MAG: hypothetical protein C4B59_00840 [Candidatus Methanogaster sp.]|uniref:Uncharacterized protein n=1 Tax=Candidatus Methanogaster sp. TaxID=3386292 RepID=A0AC61L6Y1_9EURY|nr:MAG: hypothetical protein C4B59_00840 [ANME-2 cluster archaeon]
MQACEASATTVSIADATVKPDGVIILPIMIGNITDYGTGTIEIDYNSSVVHVTAVTSGPKSQIAAQDVNNTLGFANISALSPYGVSGDIIFANVAFKAIRAGSTPVNPNVTLLGDISYNEIRSTVSDGSITVPGDATPALSPIIADGRTGATSTSVSAPSTTPTVPPTLVNTPSEGVAGENARLTPQGLTPTLKNEEIDYNYTAPTTKPTPNSSVPGFEAVFITIGLIIAVILRRCNNQ